MELSLSVSFQRFVAPKPAAAMDFLGKQCLTSGCQSRGVCGVKTVKQADVNSQYQQALIISRDAMGLGECKNGCARSEQGFTQPDMVSVILIWLGGVLIMKVGLEREPHY